jgi:hypothetical protein
VTTGWKKDQNQRLRDTAIGHHGTVRGWPMEGGSKLLVSNLFDNSFTVRVSGAMPILEAVGGAVRPGGVLHFAVGTTDAPDG